METIVDLKGFNNHFTQIKNEGSNMKDLKTTDMEIVSTMNIISSKLESCSDELVNEELMGASILFRLLATQYENMLVGETYLNELTAQIKLLVAGVLTINKSDDSKNTSDVCNIIRLLLQIVDHRKSVLL